MVLFGEEDGLKKMKIEEEIWASFITLGYFFSFFMFSLIFMVVSFPLMADFRFLGFGCILDIDLISNG